MTVLKLILNNITSNKLKYFITVLSVTISISSVILISSITTMGEVFIKQQLSDSGITSYFVNAVNDTLSDSDMENLKNRFKNIEAISPVMVEKSYAFFRGQMEQIMVWGVGEETEQLVGTKAVYGSFIDKNNIETNEKVCIVDKNLALKSYGRENIVGKTINLNVGNTISAYKVIGVIDSTQNIIKNAMGENLQPFIYIPFSTMQDVGNYEHFDKIAFSFKDNTKKGVDEIAVQNMLKREYNKNVVVKPVFSGISIIDNILITVKIILTLIASISMVVSGFMIMMVMITSVKDRTLEIGIKKALGAKNSEILKEFLLESLLISIISFFIAFIFIHFILFFVIVMFKINYVMDFNFTIGIFLFSIVIGVAFGVYPSFKASKLNPAEAFRK